MRTHLMIVIGLLLTAFSTSAQSYSFNHGPYLQELTPEAVTVVFTTSNKGFSWIELRTDDGSTSRHYAIKNGLREAYNTFHTIRLEHLKADSRYEYRLCSKQIVDFQPYKVTFGDSIVSPWYHFSTLNPTAKRCSFVALSDMHQDADKLDTLLKNTDAADVDLVFYVGDMMDYYADEAVPFRSFIDKSVERFATEHPFVLVRGNHETRGSKAREYDRYVPKTDGRYYGAYRVGEVMFVILDCGEDKPDSEEVYAGLTDFDTYRTQQAQWFEQVIQSKAYKSATWRVVMNHFPPIDPPAPWHGTEEITQKFLPLFNRANIDLMLCGHTHEYAYLTPEQYPALQFPVVINSTKSAVRVDIDGNVMQVKVLNTADSTINQLTINK